MEYNIGKALREKREEMHISLSELARETGISHQNLSRWEKNEVVPNVLFCAKIADFYEISVDDLIGRKY